MKYTCKTLTDNGSHVEISQRQTQKFSFVGTCTHVRNKKTKPSLTGQIITDILKQLSFALKMVGVLSFPEGFTLVSFSLTFY